jgi:VWFA-related protein
MTGTVVLVLWAVAVEASAPPVFSSSVESVYVDAFVTRNGRPVADLTADDFEVRDNDVPQQARLEDAGRIPITATLVLDVSGSVEGERLKRLREAGHAFLGHLTAEDAVGVLGFSHRLRLAAPHSDDVAAARRALDQVRPEGETALYDALYASLLLPTRPGPRLIVAFTDGEDTISWINPHQLLAVAEATNAVVHAVGMWQARQPDPESSPWNTPGNPLEPVVSATGGRLWNAKDDDLAQTFVRVLGEHRSRYLLAYEPTGVAREGRHKLQVRVRDGKGDVRARSGYFVAPKR